MNHKHANLTVLCTVCGNEMEKLGIWPTQFPRYDGGVVITSRYFCKHCKVPSSSLKPGYPVGVAIVEEDFA